MGTTRRGVVALALGATMISMGADRAHAQTDDEADEDAGETPVGPGTLEDGQDLLPKARITLEEAIKTAQGAASGELGEVDLEYVDGKLAFNVDIGEQDVQVDAITGEVLAVHADD